MAVQPAETKAGLSAAEWLQLETIFHAALEREPQDRAPLLDQLCPANSRLRPELDALLAVEPHARGFLATVVGELKDTLSTNDTAFGDQAPFEGTDRFELRRRLGSGGFGTVYEAFDREQNSTVALKILNRAGAVEILRFKREFRSLVDITHPNLVPLYEMLCDGEHWFFTMELVNGSHFLDYVRNSDGRCDWRRLRSALAQLAAGVNALHEAGRLHCDLKPSNVLVTDKGSVRIVDFGLVSAASDGHSLGRSYAGTPTYMAPERRQTGASSTATDWYSVGVILHQALTGRLPGAGDADPSAPESFNHLCRRLLSEDSRQRPAGHEILRLLDASDAIDSIVAPENIFVGREREIALLRDALESAGTGKTVTVRVTGGSGAGKTALVQRFLELARREENVLALSGRCYEQESVPYNALDEMVDLLVEHFERLPGAELRELMDSETALAVRLFSVLEPFAPNVLRDKIESQELKQAAFSAFRTLLARLAKLRRLIIHVDDLQWANADSLQLLAELLRPPDSPPMLVIASFRPESREPFPAPDNGASLTIELDQLAPAEAGQLASLLVPEIPRREEWVARIAAESGGNPFLLGELAQYANSAAEAGLEDSDPEPAVSVDRMLQARFSKLPREAQQLLEIVAVAAHPVESGIAWKAARYEGAQQSALALLRARHLVRVRHVQNRQEIEIYHSRLRTTLQNSLLPEVRRHRHLDLAVELENSPFGTPEALAIHFHEGGEGAKAFRYAVAAAESASRALAFESAVHWCRLALSERDDHEVRVRLADALSSSGRGKEAADTYLACMKSAPPGSQVELQRRAATDLLISGHTQEGLAALEDVLHAVGLKPPPSGRRAIPSLLLNRARIRMRGLHVPPPSSVRPDPAEAHRIDVCWSITRGFGMVDTIRAAEFHARLLLRTLRLGDPYRIARELAVEGGYLALSGEKSRQRVEQVLDTAAGLAQNCGNPHGIAIVALVRGMAAFLAGRWLEARETLDAAETLLRQTCFGVAWELATSRLMGVASSYFLGEIKRLSERLPLLLQNARARGDLYESTMEIRIAHVLHLASDQPETAMAALKKASDALPKSQFYLPHWWAFIAEIEIAIYAGDAERAWRLVQATWPTLERSLLMRSQYIHIESLFHRARAALMRAAASSRDRKGSLRSALADASAIERQQARWGIPLTALIRAGAAAIEGHSEAALRHLEFAEEGFRATDMQLFAAAVRRRQGMLLGGDEGSSLVNDADSWMRAQEIRNPARMITMLAPALDRRA